MRSQFLLVLAFLSFNVSKVLGAAPAPDDNPEGNAGALKSQIQTGGSYDASSGNATRIVNDLHVPGALGAYGLDFTRYWNSLHEEDTNPAAEWPTDFGSSGWSHSWRWSAVYFEELPEGEPPPPPVTYTTSITVTFPDGHATKFRLDRGDLNSPPLSRDRRVGPPYYAANYERNWAAPGTGVHDNLAEMAQDGSEFWLYRADGGSVHFVGSNGPNPTGGYYRWEYRATEVYDPHGLLTTLLYEKPYPFDHLLTKVVQEGGSWLTINWASYHDQPVIGSVESGGNVGSQQVGYKYALTPNDIVLYVASYPNGGGTTTSAMYNYGNSYQSDQPNVGPQSSFPLLKRADDPHYAGAMTKIRYNYWGQVCPEPHPNPTPPEIHEWYNFVAEAIAEEKSGETNGIVARFEPICQSGMRRDHNGLGGGRELYFGGSGVVGAIEGYSLTKITDFAREGVTPTTSRKQNGPEPSKVWDGRNIETDLTYDDSGGVALVHHVDDGSNYTYDRINKDTSLDQDFTRIHNTHHHWLFKKKDEIGNVTVYRRDGRRRVTDIYYYKGAETLVATEGYSYNVWNQVETHTLPSGAVQTFQYNDKHQLVLEYNSGNEERKDYQYDALGRVWRMRDTKGIADGAEYSEQMEYNSWHQITKIHYRKTHGSLDPTVTYEYDRYGNRTAIIDELGHRKDYTYDSYRRCTSLTEQAGSSPGCNNVQVRRWDWIYDRVIVYEDGSESSFLPSSHTSKEWRIQIEPEFNAEHHRRASARKFDVNNRMVSEETGLIQYQNQPLGVNLGVVSTTETHSVIYDPNGQKSSSTDPHLRVTSYTYDLRNRLETTTEPKRDNQPDPVTRIVYDVAGNKLTITFPDSTTQEWGDYDPFGQAWKFTNENRNITNLTYKWGPMKKLDTVTTSREKDDASGGTETQLTTFNYDLMGRPIQTIFPDLSDEVSTYNLGLLDTYKTRKGQKKVIDIYDARGREEHHYWLDANGFLDSSTPAVSQVWDDASRLSNIANVFSTIVYTYDQAGQVQTESTTVAGDGVARTASYCRYPSGDVSQITYPSGTIITRFYTSRGQLKDVGWGAGATSYEYNRDGTVDYQARTNGVRTNYGYDGRGIISSVQHTTDHDLTKRDYWRDKRDRILAWKRGNDPTYNLMEDGRGNRYEYDYEGQLKTASYRAENPENGATTPYRNDIFHYDKLGNREGSNYLASRGLQDFKSKNNGLNQYHKWWPYSFTFYDDDLDGWGAPGRANGVLMVDGWITGYYNALNQPVAITTSAWAGGGNSMWFGYDPLGRCVKRWVGPAIGTPPNQHAPPANTNPATYYYYDGSNLIQEGSSGGPPDRVYVHGGRVDEIVASAVGGVWSQHQYDAQGNCILLTDANGVIREQYDYDAFGFPYVYDRWGNYIGGLPGANRFLFAGREWIKELRLYDYRARMYQPELGRFLQPDPQEFAAGDYNLYRYCHNDPVNKSDPTGLVELLNEFQRDWQWDFACRGDSGNSFQGDSNSYINRGHDHTSMGTNKEADGNYNDTNMEHHLREGQPDGGTTKLTMGNEKGGVARPQLNWWVSENHMDDKTILGELEHVSRDLWSLGEGGDLSKAIKKYNANPDGTDAKKMLENARQSEHRWHLDNIHGSPNRHDLNKNGELWKKMTPAEIQNAIRTLAPIEDPRPHYLGY